MNETHYKVVWEIDAWAADPKTAAEQARQVMYAPDTSATFFTVADQNERIVYNIDLAEGWGDQAPVRILRFEGSDFARGLATVLIRRSAWFQLEPLPDDMWEVTVKAEQEQLVKDYCHGVLC